MAADKIFNTRIQSRIDTYSAWDTANPTLLRGEIAIVLVPAETGAVKQEPATLIKVGDGTSDFKSLPFLSGKAADVASWALAEVKPTYTAEEIEGLDAYIAGEIQDSNTTYNLVQDETDSHILILQKKEIGETEWTEVVRITMPDEQNEEAVQKNADDIADLKALVGTTAVSAQIAAAIEALKLSETYATITALGETNAEVAAVRGIAEGAADAASKAQGAADAAQGAADAAQGAADAAQGAADAAQGAADEAKATADAIKADYLKGADKQALEAVDAGHDQRITALEGTITGLSGAMHFKDAVESDPTAEGFSVEGYVAGDVVTFGDKEYVFNGTKFVEFGDVSAEGTRISTLEQKVGQLETTAGESAAAIEVLNGADTVEGSIAKQIKDAVAGHETNVAATYATKEALKTTDELAQSASSTASEAKAAAEANAATLKTLTEGENSVDSKIENAIEELDLANTYAAKGDMEEAQEKLATIEEGAQVNVIEKVKVNGVELTPDADKAVDVTVPTGALASKDEVAESDLDSDLQAKIAAKANDEDLAAVAKSGNVNDLVQDTGDYFVINCGTSAATF